MRVEVKRRGGLAGVTLRAELATTDLDGDVAARVEQAIGKLLDSRAPASAPHPDMFEYEINVPERSDSVVVAEHDLPDELRPLIEMLSEQGTIESTRKRPA